MGLDILHRQCINSCTDTDMSGTSSIAVRISLGILLLALSARSLFLNSASPGVPDSDYSPPANLHIYKRRPEMGAQGFIGDSLSGGFGDFYTMKRSEAKSNKIEAKLDYIINLLSPKQK